MRSELGIPPAIAGPFSVMSANPAPPPAPSIELLLRRGTLPELSPRPLPSPNPNAPEAAPGTLDAELKSRDAGPGGNPSSACESDFPASGNPWSIPSPSETFSLSSSIADLLPKASDTTFPAVSFDSACKLPNRSSVEDDEANSLNSCFTGRTIQSVPAATDAAKPVNKKAANRPRRRDE